MLGAAVQREQRLGERLRHQIRSHLGVVNASHEVSEDRVAVGVVEGPERFRLTAQAVHHSY